MTRLKNRLYSFYSSELSNYVEGILIVSTGLFGFLYTRSAWVPWLWMAAPLWALLFSLAAGRVLISIRYRALRLFLYRHSGVLSDKRYGLRNIALRSKTITTILSQIPTAKRYETGVNIGRSFHEDFATGCKNIEGADFDNIPLDKRIKRWIAYDSSSGMGKFSCEISDASHFLAHVTVANAFTIGPNTDGNCCRLIEGYIAGFFSALLRKDIHCSEVRCGNQGEQGCVFELREVTNPGLHPAVPVANRE